MHDPAKTSANVKDDSVTTSFNGNVVVEMSSTSHRPRTRTLLSSQAPSSWFSKANRRQQALTNLQFTCRQQFNGEHIKLTQDGFCQLFSKTEVLKLLFQLFDYQSEGKLLQSCFIEFLKDKLGVRGKEFVDLLDTVTYVIAGESDLDFQVFCRIFLAKGVLSKLYKLINAEQADNITVENLMSFITEMTLYRTRGDLNVVEMDCADKFFRTYIKDGTELTLEDFKKMIPCKNPFFAERAFRIFDKDGSNSISIVEFRESLEQFCSTSVEDKVRFLFQIYDQDGDGQIKLQELNAVLKVCSEENGMSFSKKQLEQLTLALYEDALYEDATADPQDLRSGIGYEQLKAQMAKHPGLLDNLSISLERFILPNSGNKKKQKGSILSSLQSSWAYVKNNAAFLSFVVAYLLVNCALFISRSIQYANYPMCYMLARASGQCLNFNCVFVLVLMLRHCITWLRMRGLASFLPLDKHVYLHKMCGTFIVFFAFLHTLMHIINFPMNIAGKYKSSGTNDTHTSIEWLFTMVPQQFGLIPGLANLTGWVLAFILTIMVLFSLPFVRKSGSFEVFYWTHLLYIPFWIVLIFHCENFCYWFIGPGTLYIVVEKSVRFRRRWAGKGQTYISSAVLLPSRVTHLVIRKPPNFHYHPGDYVYVKIPSLASYEWHPFTISSAPELPDSIWLHIRGAGGWTNQLYDYFEREQAKICLEQKTATLERIQCQRCSSILELSNPSPFSGLVKKKPSKKTERKNLFVDEEPSCQLLNYSASINSFLSPIDETVDEIVNEQSANNLLPATIPQACRQISRSVSIRSRPEDFKETSYRYMRHKPGVINIPVPGEEYIQSSIVDLRKLDGIPSTPRAVYAPDTLVTKNKQFTFDDVSVHRRRLTTGSADSVFPPNKTTGAIQMNQPLEITIDGPYGAPSSHIFRAEHAVLIAAGIGVTPFASILQSIMNRYYSYARRQTCPQCLHSWTSEMPESIMNLKKVDFFWINRDQRSFEWFVNLLSQLEMEQAEKGGVMERFLDLHMYITSALKKTDMKAVGLQMALDLMHAKEKRDLVTGLKTRTNAGRPNWDKVFQKLCDEGKGKVTVFYCGPPQLAKELRLKCDEFGFSFRKEIF